LGEYCLTDTFTTKVKLLALHFFKHLQKLLEEAHELFCQIILVLEVYSVRSRGNTSEKYGL